jgi:uncharacterized glyoxalase superfamily protein PhnB
MSQQLTAGIANIYPCLTYRDPAAAIEWLTRAFGFEQRMAAPGPDGTIVHAELTLGPGVIMLGSAKAERGWLSPLDLPAVNQSVCVYVEDPAAHYQRAKAAGAEMVFEYKDYDYGGSGYTAKDLEGHSWTFGSYLPGGYWE